MGKFWSPGDAFDIGVTFANQADTLIAELSVNAAPGPIPGAGLLSYLALGTFGLGSAGWKRLRMRSV